MQFTAKQKDLMLSSLRETINKFYLYVEHIEQSRVKLDSSMRDLLLQSYKEKIKEYEDLYKFISQITPHG